MRFKRITAIISAAIIGIMALSVVALPVIQVKAAAMDIGASAIDRGSWLNISNITAINLENPASASGTIDTVQIYPYASSLTGVIVATFYADGANYTPRDTESIGTVAGGDVRTFTGLSLDVQAGDYLGLYAASAGYIERDTSGYAGVLYASGNHTGDSTSYSTYAGDAISLYGTGESLLSAPTNVTASDGTYTDKVGITWTKATGATGYKIYRDAELIDTVGDVATYDDTGADAPVITAGTASATDGTYTNKVALSISGESVADGTTHSYTVVATDGSSDSDPSDADTGYRGHGALGYQWQISAADSDADYSNITGATTAAYDATDIPTLSIAAITDKFIGFGRDWAVLKGSYGAGTSAAGRYFRCVLSATGATSQNSTADRGYASGIEGTPTLVGFDYGATTAYSSGDVTFTPTGTDYAYTIRDLQPASVYHFRAKVYDGSAWYYGADSYFCTVGSPVVYEFMNTGADADSDPIYASDYAYEQFTVGDTSHTVVVIKIRIKRTGAPGTILVELKHADESGYPSGIALASDTIDGNYISTSYITLSFTVDETSIEAAGAYCIVVSAPEGDGSNYIEWQANSSGGLDDAVGGYSTDGGNTWADDSPTDFLFEVWGNACIRTVSALVYPNYLETGDLLFCIEYINIYPPYYQTTDASQYFVIQLLDTDGVTPIAAVPMLEWGNMPASIYLSADAAQSITSGGAYYIAITGLFGDNPTATYQLQSTDWNGNLNGWVIATAHDMEKYYDSYSLTTIKAGVGTVLTSDKNGGGGSTFEQAIPYLMYVRPELFEAIQYNENFVPPPTHAPAASQSMVNTFGEGIADTLATIGGWFNVSSNMVGMFFMFVIYIGVAIAVAAGGGNAVVALGLGIPIMIFGMWGIMSSLYVLFFVAIAVMAFMALIDWWVTRT